MCPEEGQGINRTRGPPSSRRSQSHPRSVPTCGPARATRTNPAGLTARQRDVLELLMTGATNAQIAERLVLSVRTADNHVAAVLHKLGVHQRADAVRRAAELGLRPAASEVGSARPRPG